MFINKTKYKNAEVQQKKQNHFYILLQTISSYNNNNLSEKNRHMSSHKPHIKQV